jgi:hypothetical protein
MCPLADRQPAEMFATVRLSMSFLLQPGACRAHYELRFSSLNSGGQNFAFPCDAQGQVDIGGLSERSRNNYFYARAVIGRKVSPPSLALVE